MPAGESQSPKLEPHTRSLTPVDCRLPCVLPKDTARARAMLPKDTATARAMLPAGLWVGQALDRSRQVTQARRSRSSITPAWLRLPRGHSP